MPAAKKRKILVTSALPYANGPIHLGHLLEGIQTDIWVRYQKFCENETYYFCADDTHGTAIMLAAKKENLSPEEYVNRIQKEHYRDFTSFGVEYDNYYSTNSPENKKLSEAIYLKAKEKNHIAKRSLSQLFCETDNIFLPDRFVKGTCPKCKSPDQYGDSCEVCSSTYNPKDLINPFCAICGSKPIEKETDHLFFKLSDFQKSIQEWMPNRVDAGVKKKMDEWLKEGGLRDWDISRDGPYFGFEIPGETNKFFYVWLDAPIGYMASALQFFEKKKQKPLFDEFWTNAKDTEVYHFIGKDIIYFHTLFWPALLLAGGYRSPTSVFVHGFVTVNGEKMSKSRGTLVKADTYLRCLDPMALRWYYASKLGNALDDIDIGEEDFVNKYNSDVVGNLTNIFSRLCGSLAQKIDSRIGPPSEEGLNLKVSALSSATKILAYYEKREYSRAVKELAFLGDTINKFISDREPWKLIKSDAEATRSVISDALTAGRILAGLVKPILPVFGSAVEELLALETPITANNLDWSFPQGHTLRPYRNLSARVDLADFRKMYELEKETTSPMSTPTSQPKTNPEEATGINSTGIISIDDLAKVQLRVGRIIEAKTVEGADKLLQIQLDVGDGRNRNVFAGIRSSYDPEELQGLNVVAVTNLAPRKMKFGISEAMLLASTGSDGKLSLFVPHRSVKPGELLK